MVNDLQMYKQRIEELEKENSQLKRELEFGKNEEIASNSLKLLQEITNHIPAFIAQVDSNLNYVFANNYYTSMLGHTPASMIGKNIKEILQKETYEIAFPNFQKALNGETVYFENRGTTIHNNTVNSRKTYIP
ncbi:MAG: hypothetical protein C0594_16015 [Marinilabiliales bacterium]|nr:MAG: hypothetical protein C0594_16015 [Marinilabiliales bacterium]